MKTIDTRGLSCPEPVILTKKALALNESEYEVLADRVTSRDNIIGFAEDAGYKATYVEDNGEYKITLKK